MKQLMIYITAEVANEDEADTLVSRIKSKLSDEKTIAILANATDTKEYEKVLPTLGAT